MSYILLRAGDRLLSLKEGTVGFAGHSDRSAYRTEERKELEEIAEAPSEELARTAFRTMRIERVRELEEKLAADGRSASVDGLVTGSNGIGHWFTQRGEIYRRTGSGTVYPDEESAMTPAQAVDALWSAPMLCRVQARRPEWPTVGAW